MNLFFHAFMRFTTLIFVVITLFTLTDCNKISDPALVCDEKLSSESLQFAIRRVLVEADSIISLPALTVTSKPETGITEDNRNYVSLATYWWPNPETEDGLPYIRKDGKVNPETVSAASDFPKLVEAAKRIELLAAAFSITGNEAYAKSALNQLHFWFIDSQTFMFPHLEYAQGIKGRSAGRSYGVIDTWWLVRVVNSFDLLQHSAYWTNDVETQLQNWFTHYLNWLRNSRFGESEKHQHNNHATWYDVQILTFSRFVEQTEFSNSYLEEVSIPRISKQVSKSGRQKEELKRTLPVHYSIYNLYGLIQIAKFQNSDSQIFNESIKEKIGAAVLHVIKLAELQDIASLASPLDPTDTDILYLRLLFDASPIANDLQLSMYAECKLQENLSDNHRLALSYPSLPKISVN